MNEELMQKIAAVETAEELTKVLDENGIALEEGVTPQQFLDTMKASDGDELGEDALDDVSGGVIGTAALAAGAAVLGMSVAKYIKWLRKRKRW